MSSWCFSPSTRYGTSLPTYLPACLPSRSPSCVNGEWVCGRCYTLPRIHELEEDRPRFSGECIVSSSLKPPKWLFRLKLKLQYAFTLGERHTKTTKAR